MTARGHGNCRGDRLTMRGYAVWGRWIAVCVVAVAVVSCANPTADEQKTEGEWIRELLATDGDALSAFSTAWMADQVGTNDFYRTIDSVHRGYVGTRFFTDSAETQSARQAFDARVYDSVWGTLSFRVGVKMVEYRYLKLLYAGKVLCLRLGGTISQPNPWELWKMEYRFGGQPGVGSPIVEQVTVAGNGQTKQIIPRKLVRLFRDSVLTLHPDSLTNVTVTVQSATTNDSFFVTYPKDGVYLTQVMAHDSVTHTATVPVRSGARFDVIGVQGFKRRAFESEAVGGAVASSIETALIRFYRP